MGSTARRVTSHVLTVSQIQAYRQKLQRLEQRTTEALPPLVGAIGWVPTTGGSSPYLALRARAPRWDRHLVDQAVFSTYELAEVPTPTGFALVPTSEAWLALWAARRAHDRAVASWRTGVDARKVGKLRQNILGALKAGPASQDELRANEADTLCSPLNAAGRQAGFPTLFALALRELSLDGLVVRRQRAGRLDRATVVLTLPKLPLAAPEVAPSRAIASLVRRYFEAFGIASAGAFARWSGLSPSEAESAIVEAGLQPALWEGSTTLFTTEQSRAELAVFTAPVPPRLAFVPYQDPICRSVETCAELLPTGFADTTLGCDANGRTFPAQHPLVIGGRVAGVWRYDVDERKVEYATFVPLPTRMRRAADDAADQLAGFVEDQLDEAGFGAALDELERPALEVLQARWRAKATAG